MPRAVLHTSLLLVAVLAACNSFGDLDDPSPNDASSAGSGGSSGSAGTIAGSSGSGGDAGAAGEGGSKAPACTKDDDCPQPLDPCSIAICQTGDAPLQKSCVTIPHPKPETVELPQVEGDCQMNVCANGITSSVPASEDLPIANGVCDVTSCNDDTPMHADVDTACPNAHRCVAGTCECKPCLYGSVQNAPSNICQLVDTFVDPDPLSGATIDYSNVLDGNALTGWKLPTTPTGSLSKDGLLFTLFDSPSLAALVLYVAPLTNDINGSMVTYQLQVDNEPAQSLTVPVEHQGEIIFPLEHGITSEFRLRFGTTKSVMLYEVGFKQCP